MNRPDNLDAPPPEPNYLSTVQVAKAVGVSVTTIKRWVDDGILPAYKTPGGHRKLVLADVLRLTREGGLPQADLSQLTGPARGGPADPAVVHEQLLDAVKAVDADRIRATLRGAYQSGITIETLADQIISPAMVFVGRQWQHARIDVGEEHLVTQAVVAAMYEVRGMMMSNAPKARPVAIGGAPEHDHYILPSLLAKLTLLEAGWNAVNIGPHTPASAFIHAMQTLEPALVWISVSHIEDVSLFELDYKHLYQVAQAKGIPVSIGGRALTPELRARLPYTAFGDGMAQFGAFARSLNPPAQRPRRGRPPANRN
jgi:excisionase family DNA binding protein